MPRDNHRPLRLPTTSPRALRSLAGAPRVLADPVHRPPHVPTASGNWYRVQQAVDDYRRREPSRHRCNHGGGCARSPKHRPKRPSTFGQHILQQRRLLAAWNRFLFQQTSSPLHKHRIDGNHEPDPVAGRNRRNLVKPGVPRRVRTYHLSTCLC